jgi:hypothetical protein
MIHNWMPWLNSSGPRTPEGKRRSGLNGRKPNLIRRELAILQAELRMAMRLVRAVEERRRRR